MSKFCEWFSNRSRVSFHNNIFLFPIQITYHLFSPITILHSKSHSPVIIKNDSLDDLVKLYDALHRHPCIAVPDDKLLSTFIFILDEMDDISWYCMDELLSCSLERKVLVGQSFVDWAWVPYDLVKVDHVKVGLEVPGGEVHCWFFGLDL